MFPYLQIGPLTISTYFLLISIAAVIGTVWFLRRNSARELSRLVAIDFTLVALTAGFLGARLAHVFYEEPDYYSGHWLKVFEVWNGGFVFLGGVFAGVAATQLYCSFKRVPFLFMCDLAAIPLSFTYALGRVACFLNGCCYGRYCELPWAVNLNGVHRHPTQLYATFWEASVLAILIVSQRRLKSPGQIAGLWLTLHGLGRILMEAFRDDPRGAPIAGMSLATWLSFVMISAGILLVWPSGRPAVVPDMHS